VRGIALADGRAVGVLDRRQLDRKLGEVAQSDAIVRASYAGGPDNVSATACQPRGINV
jgi:hypothetical protein